MKKPLLLFFGCWIPALLFGINSIPNGDFESWQSGSYNYPENYFFNSCAESPDLFIKNGVAFNIEKSTPSYAGDYAVQLTTKQVGDEVVPGYFLNFQPGDGDFNTWHGGIPYTQKPTGIRGYYKYNVATADSALIIVGFSKAGSNIGTYYAKVGGLHSSYTLFEIPFSPALTETPDSVMFVVASSWEVISEEGNGGMVGSTLTVDSISFTGVTSQPTLFNGDFESWKSVTVDALQDWNAEGDIKGITKTEGSHTGDYAVELTTYLDENDGEPQAQPAVVSTGYYSDSNSYQYPLGGYPFTNQIDTLTFYYKYIPVNNDVAQVCVFFKNGSSYGWNNCSNLQASANYQYVELPLNAGYTPDSVIVQVQSSYWENKTVNFVGSKLTIDDMAFKSQSLSTGIFNRAKDNSSISLFPNPATDAFQINGIEDGSTLTILDIKGGKVFEKAINNGEKIPVSSLDNGVYIVSITSKNSTQTQKLVIRK